MAAKKGNKPKVEAKAKAISKTTIKEGDRVKIEYEGKLEDGTVFDSSERHGQPLEFTLGEGHIIKGFEKALIGMKKGQEKEIKIAPEEAYGIHNPQLIKKIPRKDLPQEQEPKPGMLLVIGLPNGQQIPTKITKVTKDEITIDLNHPLAGQILIFKVKVLEVF